MKPLPEQTNTVDGYIAQYPDEIQKRLEELRKLIKEIVPESIENISYRMPSYRTKPGKRPFVYIGVATHHIGVYALHENLSPDLQEKIKPYIGGRGTLQFTNDKPLPLDLIKDILMEKRSETGL
jgi:uncharacterized protein YdhG (YjbR/CyaY superfamily)